MVAPADIGFCDSAMCLSSRGAVAVALSMYRQLSARGAVAVALSIYRQLLSRLASLNSRELPTMTPPSLPPLRWEPDLRTFRALYHEAGLVSGIWACKLGRKPQKSCLAVNVGRARLPLNDCTHRLDARLDYNAKGQ